MAAEYILALDYGKKRVGVAITHVIARLARPLVTLTNDESLVQNIRDLIQAEGVALVIVGLPRGMDGGYTAQTRTAEAFAQSLAAELSVPVEMADETLTSIDAEVLLGNKVYDKADVDALAAANILERYLAENPIHKAPV